MSSSWPYVGRTKDTTEEGYPKVDLSGAWYKFVNFERNLCGDELQLAVRGPKVERGAPLPVRGTREIRKLRVERLFQAHDLILLYKNYWQ